MGLFVCFVTALGCEKTTQSFLPEDSGAAAPTDVGGGLDASAAQDSGTPGDRGVMTADRGSSDAGVVADAGPIAQDAGPIAQDAAAADAGGTVGTCNAVDLGSRTGPSVAMGSTLGGRATLEGSCGGDLSEEAVFAWTAPGAGRFTFDLAGSGYDTVLYLRDGLCATAELDCNDDTDKSVQSAVTVTLRAGQQVTIVIDGYEGDTGDFVLAIRPAP